MADRPVVYELKNVSKDFENEGKQFRALDKIDLEIYEGEIFGIIGMSGAGKSTLVRTLNRLEEVSEGQVNFYGKNIGELKPAELRKIRRSISMIFQSFNLLNQRTVLENVMIPLKIAKVSRKERKKKERKSGRKTFQRLLALSFCWHLLAWCFPSRSWRISPRCSWTGARCF